MPLADIHHAIAQEFRDSIAVAFNSKQWNALVGEVVRLSFGPFMVTSQPSMLPGIVFDATMDAPGGVIVSVTSKDSIAVGGLELSVTLRADGVATGNLATYRIRFAAMVAKLAVKNGIVTLEPTNGSKYVTYPPDITDPDRPLHIDYLTANAGWTAEELDYYLQQIEPGVGYQIVSAFISDAFTEMEIFNLASLFPGISFRGEFTIKDLTVPTGEQLVCFAPDAFTKLDPTECAKDEVASHIVMKGSVAANDIDGVVTAATPSIKARKYYEQNPLGANIGQIYGYMPHNVLNQLFNPELTLVKDTTMTVVEDSGEHRVGPFMVKHFVQMKLRGMLALGPSMNGPIVDVVAAFYTYTAIDIDLKIGRFRTDLVSANARVDYELNYDGTLYSDLPSGNLGFVGEFYDPKNFDYKVGLNTPLPGVMDKVMTWFVNSVCKPVVRIFVTAILVTVTWPFMSRFSLPSNGSGAGASGLFHP